MFLLLQFSLNNVKKSNFTPQFHQKIVKISKKAQDYYCHKSHNPKDCINFVVPLVNNYNYSTTVMLDHGFSERRSDIFPACLSG